MRLWLSICGALVFAAGVSVGVLVKNGGFCDLDSPRPPDDFVHESAVASMVDPYPDYPLYLVSSDEVYDELGLDDEQRRRIEALLAAHFEGIRTVRAGMAGVAANLREGVVGVLTAEQLARFREIQNRYSATKRRFYVGSQLVKLRQVIDFGPEQEAVVYKAFYDYMSSVNELYDRKPCLGRGELRKRIRRLAEKRDGRLEHALSEEQFAIYAKFRESEGCMNAKDKRRRSKKSEEGDAARPQAAASAADCTKVDP